MGTPTIIRFTGTDSYNTENPMALYRHYDGDPVTQLALLAKIIAKGVTLVHSSKADYRENAMPSLAERCKLTPATLAGLYIGETTDSDGMNAHVIENPEDAYGQWIYTVDVDAGTISVSDEDDSPVDPFSYIERLVDEAQASHRGALEEAIELLDESFDFQVLPGERAEV
jgi:hypothetical protein